MPVRKKVTVAVVCGGSSPEAAVSRSSGTQVAHALRASFKNVVLYELDRRLTRHLASKRPDVVFPVLHGPPGEDGSFQGFLEILGIPYVGSGVRSSMCAMDKILAKQIFRAASVPVARDVIVHKHAPVHVHDILETLGGRVVVKPSQQGSAIGVGFAHDGATLKKALRRAFTYDERVLIEEQVFGKEITVGILERQGIEALPVIEIQTPKGSWYDYKHRYTRGLSKHIIPARLSKKQYDRVLRLAAAAHRALGCRDLSRVDFIVPKTGNPIVLEVNTLPGMTPTSLYPDAAKAAGISFEELVAHLVKRAVARAQRA